jgi:signal transduction histidine kinase
MPEITDIPPLTPGEASLVDNHSLVNTLSVLRGELEVLGLVTCGDFTLLKPAVSVCEQMLAALTDPAETLREAERVEEHEKAILRVVAARLPRDRSSEMENSLANIHSVFAILRVRAQELRARAAAPTLWRPFDPKLISSDLMHFCAAVERNSRGRFHIVFNPARQRDRDYYVDLRIEAANPSGLVMPPVFHDVIRDLFANSRKYTAPGGKIIVALFEDQETLDFVVADTGRGIPPDEIATVAHFGQRASNVADVRTQGGGFGLTKAFLTTKQHHGRFWIDSTLGRGTEIRIRVPATPDAIRHSTPINVAQAA